MTALVTGGSGLVCSVIVPRPLELGYEGVVPDDLASGFVENLVPEVPFFGADVRDAESVAVTVGGCNVASRLAASVGPLQDG